MMDVETVEVLGYEWHIYGGSLDAFTPYVCVELKTGEYLILYRLEQFTGTDKDGALYGGTREVKVLRDELPRATILP